MEPQGEALRQKATKAFFDAIEHLPDALQPNNHEEENQIYPPLPSSKSGKKTASVPQESFDIHDLEEAAADIEQYINALHPELSESTD